MINQFISTLFASRTQAHIFHLQTDSFAAHKALQDYYDNIIELTDGLTESYQGKYGIVQGYTSPAMIEYSNCEETIKYFTALDMYVAKSRERLPQDSYIQNQVDTIVELINSTIYKLKFLQ
jgi:hypothetical protein